MRYVGIDVGGTAIKAGLLDETGSLLESSKTPTPADSLDDLVETLLQCVEEVRSRTSISGIGIGIPGLRSARTRTIETSPHIPCLAGVNLEDLIQQKTRMPVITENDANAGAYGEWACGAARGLQHMAYITLGTGLGCGLVMSGKMFRGASGYAGELGHTVIEAGGRQCACGSRGCLETRVSATGIVETARERGMPESLTAKSVHREATLGNQTARAVFEETGRLLGIACSNLINLLNLQMIVVGGGVMASGDLLLEPARQEAAKRAFPPSARDCPIVQSQLWPDSGIVGAAMLARDSS
jgi:glucokinase